MIHVARQRIGSRIYFASTMVVLFLCVGEGTYGKNGGPEPAEVMQTFERAFHVFDYRSCRSLLAKGARVTIVRRLQGGDFQSESEDAFAWIDGVGQNVKPLKDFKVEFLEIHTLMNVHGATVVYRSRSTGVAPRGDFTNNATISANLIREDGQWKILHYSMFEDFRWTPQPKQ